MAAAGEVEKAGAGTAAARGAAVVAVAGVKECNGRWLL